MNSDVPDSEADGRAWSTWGRRRPGARGAHFDTAAAGRSSEAVLQGTYDHARLEAQVGAYVAQELAAPVLDSGRAALANLLGVASDGLAFVESASVALRCLLAVWPLAAGSTVAVAPSEWGPNLEAFAGRGLAVTEVETLEDGRVDLEQLDRLLATSPPALVHLTHVASHRALVQPVAAAAELCREVGVPLWVDAAQALGHVDAASGADAIYSTSRKWLTGPRGVGMVGVKEAWWDKLAVRVPAMAVSGTPVVRLLESQEAHIAGRVGLSLAVHEHLDLGPEAVRGRLREVGRTTRESLDGVRGWEVVDPRETPSAITALRPTDGQDLASTRDRLISEHGIVTTVAAVARAPREMTSPLLRISPHVDCSAEDLSRLRTALTSG